MYFASQLWPCIFRRVLKFLEVMLDGPRMSDGLMFRGDPRCACSVVCSMLPHVAVIDGPNHKPARPKLAVDEVTGF
jgi:hypothetical protein